MILRQLFDSKSSTYTYLIGCLETNEAVLIDPVFEQVNRDLALLSELGLKLKYAIDTHCHADHVTGAWLLKHHTNCQIACAANIEAENTDLALSDGDQIVFGASKLSVRATPGHTDGCLTYVSDDLKCAFTGDALLIRGCGRCDFQQGDAGQLFDSIQQQIFALPEDYLLYPGHDYSGRTVTSVAEEKAHNTRIGGEASKQDFVGFMANMTLPHPKFIDIALPANLKCGEPENVPASPNWAPLNLTFAGVYEVDPQWVYQNKDSVTLLDVRDSDELNQARVGGELHIPLNELEQKVMTISTDKPIVAFCRSGRRSALALNILAKAGVTNLANVKGGMIEWQQQGLPLAKD